MRGSVSPSSHTLYERAASYHVIVGHGDPGGVDDEARAATGCIGDHTHFRIEERALRLDLHDRLF